MWTRRKGKGAPWLNCVWVFCEIFFLFCFWWWVSSSLVFVVGGGLRMWCGIWTRKFCLWWVIWRRQETNHRRTISQGMYECHLEASLLLSCGLVYAYFCIACVEDFQLPRSCNSPLNFWVMGALFWASWNWFLFFMCIFLSGSFWLLQQPIEGKDSQEEAQKKEPQ